MPSLSYWEKDAFLASTDVLVIGSGIVGLSTAIELKLKAPTIKVTVAERGSLPTGASTKNAGFACFGSMTELISDLKSHQESAVFELVERRWKGLLNLRSLLGDEKLRFQQFGGYEVFKPSEIAIFEECLSHVDQFNSLLEEIINTKNVFQVADKKIAEFGFGQVDHLIFNKLEGQIHTGWMMRAMLDKARGLGIQIFNGIEITRLEEGGKFAQAYTRNGWMLQAKKIVAATNGFSKQLVSDIDLQPARNQVLITKPLDSLPFRSTFHYDRGYFYFRNVDCGGSKQRVLLGGGRNLDAENETTSEFGQTEIIQSALKNLLREMILPNQKFEIDSWWSGILGVGNHKKPVIKMVSPSIGVAIRLGGMGVAIGTLVGKEAASMIFSRI